MTGTRQAGKRAMKLFSNLPIALKILTALGLMTILAIAVAVGAVRELGRLNELTQRLATDDARSLYLASAANEHMSRAHQLLFEMILVNDADEIATFDRQVDQELQTLHQRLGALRPFMDGDTEESTFAEVSKELGEYESDAAKVRASARANDDRAAQDELREAVPLFRRVDAALTRLVDQQNKDLADAASRAQQRFELVVRTTITVTALGIVITLALSLLIIRVQVTRPLKGMTSMMGEL